ncbi:hypothetical protein OIV83_003511 [Microbotryomycetes sp. JL201]|nr:hypothetical protein OIV83_003511 [Microbotryomycetes sp. JL201]
MEEGQASIPKAPFKKGKRSNQARFPAARIKKMIQADEDVGKVATGTPIVVSRALEMFLKSLVDETVKDAQQRGSKKLTAYGLKRTIQNTSLFDFCSEIVQNVPDPIVDADNGENGEAGTKKKRAPRKKKDAAVATATSASGETKPKASKKKRKASEEDDEDDFDEEEDDDDAGGPSKAPKYDDDDYEG